MHLPKRRGGTHACVCVCVREIKVMCVCVHACAWVCVGDRASGSFRADQKIREIFMYLCTHILK